MGEFSNPPKTIEEYQERANPDLKKFGKVIVDDKYYSLMKTLVWTLVIAVIILGYAIYEDKFKTECPTFSCPEIPANVPCPSCPQTNCNIDCGDVNFPDSLEINIINQTE